MFIINILVCEWFSVLPECDVSNSCTVGRGRSCQNSNWERQCCKKGTPWKHQKDNSVWGQKRCWRSKNTYWLITFIFSNQSWSPSSELLLAGLTGMYRIVNMTNSWFCYLPFTDKSFIGVILPNRKQHCRHEGCRQTPVGCPIRNQKPSKLKIIFH